jgi:hypothetical protein
MNLIGLFPRSFPANWDWPFQGAHPTILSPKQSTVECHSLLLPLPPPILEAIAPPAAIIMTGGWVGGCLITRLVGSEYHQPWP